MRGLWVATCVALVCACSFDESGIGARDGDVIDATVMDASVNDTMATDAGPCPVAVLAQISIDGVTSGAPFKRVLVGDTITLSATASCSQTPGQLSYEWQISPIDGTRESAEPNLLAPTLTVYPVNAQQYTVSLTVRDVEGGTDTTQVFGFEAHGWQLIDGIPSNEIRDLAVGNDNLFIAGLGGPFRVPLDNPTSGFVNINNETVGAGITTNLQSVLWDADAEFAWFAALTSRGSLWKVSRTVPFTSTEVFYNTASAFNMNATVRDLGPLSTGIELVADRGVAETIDNITFTETSDIAAYAVARGGGQRWSGGSKLYDLDDGGTVFDPLAAGDNKIRTLLVDAVNDELWIGTDNNGMARVTNSTGVLIQVYTTAGSDLPDNRIRAMAMETVGPFTGDIWIATQDGIGRFKRDRQVWLTMQEAHGLTSRTDLKAIAIDENNGRRRIYAGSTGGLVYSRAE